MTETPKQEPGGGEPPMPEFRSEVEQEDVRQSHLHDVLFRPPGRLELADEDEYERALAEGEE